MLTLDELNTRITEMFLSSQLEYIEWDNLSDGDKLVALKNALLTINRLQFIGRKVEEDQPNVFPRRIDIWGVRDGVIVDTPDCVRDAICQYCYDFLRIRNTDIYETINSGVTSRQIHNIRETYDLNSISTDNREYLKYLSDWIYRGVR